MQWVSSVAPWAFAAVKMPALATSVILPVLTGTVVVGVNVTTRLPGASPVVRTARVAEVQVLMPAVVAYMPFVPAVMAVPAPVPDTATWTALLFSLVATKFVGHVIVAVVPSRIPMPAVGTVMVRTVPVEDTANVADLKASARPDAAGVVCVMVQPDKELSLSSAAKTLVTTENVKTNV